MRTSIKILCHTIDAIEINLAQLRLTARAFDGLCAVADGEITNPAFQPTFDAIDRLHGEVEPSMVEELLCYMRGF